MSAVHDFAGFLVLRSSLLESAIMFINDTNVQDTQVETLQHRRKGGIVLEDMGVRINGSQGGESPEIGSCRLLVRGEREEWAGRAY